VIDVFTLKVICVLYANVFDNLILNISLDAVNANVTGAVDSFHRLISGKHNIDGTDFEQIFLSDPARVPEINNTLSLIVAVSFHDLDFRVTVHHQYNDVSNQQDATTFSFINLFKSARHVSGDKFVHPQEHSLTIYTVLVADRCTVPKAVYTKCAPQDWRICRPKHAGLI